MSDSRVRLRTQILAGDYPDLVGERVEQLSVFQMTNGRIATFVTPSIAHLALDTAVDSAHKANAFRSTIVTSVPSRNVIPGEVRHYRDGERPGALYDMFLNATSTAIFSYLAIENFANEVIGRHADQIVGLTGDDKPRNGRGGKKSEKRREKETRRRASETEAMSLSAKLTEVLPQLTGIPIEKGREPYQTFWKLEKTRHHVVHWKSSSTAPRIFDPKRVPRNPLWTGFLLDDSLWMPKTALNIIRHFQIDTLPLDWLNVVEDKMNKPTQLDLPASGHLTEME